MSNVNDSQNGSGQAATPSTPTPGSPVTRPSPVHRDSEASSKGTRTRGSSSASGRVRAASLKFMESNPPSGFMAATGEVAGKAPTLADIRRNSFGSKAGRKNSISSIKEARGSASPVSPQAPQLPPMASPTIMEDDHKWPEEASAPTTTAGKEKRRTRDFADIMEDDDFAAKMLGSGKIQGQSYVKGASQKAPEPASTATDNAIYDSDNDSLADLDPRPKRRSKNMSAMLGEKDDASKPLEKPTPSAARPSSSKRNTRDFADMIESGDYEPSKGRFDNQAYTPSTTRRPSQNLMSAAGPEPSTLGTDGTTSDAPPTRHSKGLSSIFGDTKRHSHAARSTPSPDPTKPGIGPNAEGYYPNGYHFPAKKTWKEATLIGLKATAKFPFSSILNFLITIYGLNVVAWGGMLFLLLCNAAPAMCRLENPPGGYDCNDLYSPRRVWIEVDSQILNALFCVTGFGLVPWRFRDLYFLLKWRVGKSHVALRRLAGIHNGWFRLQGSEEIPVKDVRGAEGERLVESDAVPIPASKAPGLPLTGVRSEPTKLWKMDYVVWAFVVNTFLQCVLSGFMWGLNRFDRPSWSTGTFVALACIVAAMGGLMQFLESKRIKKVEGVPLPEGELGVGTGATTLELGNHSGANGQNGRKDKEREAVGDVEKL